MKILLVEDDPLLGDGVYTGLRRENNNVDWVKNGESSLVTLSESQYDCIILDIGLPKMSGYDVLQIMRESDNNTPVLILTAQDEISDRVNGLDAGADDYLVKPFEFAELSARLRALARRVRGKSTETIHYKDIKINTTANTVEYKGKEVELSQREFSLLIELITNQGRVLSRRQLEQKLYRWGEDIESNTIEVHIHHLRKKFNSDLVKTVRGIGYIIAKE